MKKALWKKEKNRMDDETKDETQGEQTLVTYTFNPAQLATWKQAKELAKQIAQFRAKSGTFMGGGVAAVTGDVDTSGIYVPGWVGGPGGFPEPSGLGTYWLFYRFVNGVSGLNVGLILDMINRYDGNTTYVFTWLNTQLQVN